MAKKTYLVNWRLEGLTKSPLQAGDTVDLEPAAAEEFLGIGVLSERTSAPDPKA